MIETCTIPRQILDQWKEQYARLLEGDRWCSACGRVAIEAGNALLPSFAFKCWSCYKLWRDTAGKGPEIPVKDEAYTGSNIYPHTKQIRLSSCGMTRYCGRCGDVLDEKRMRFALFNSGGKVECSRCLKCSRGWKEPANPGAKIEVYVPDAWMPHLGLVTGVSQLQLL